MAFVAAAPALWASIASTVVAAGSAIASGVAQRNQARYQSAVAQNNAIVAEQNAAAELERGRRLEDAKRMETAQREGAIRAAVGSGGLDVNSGSPLRLQEDSALVGELDALTIRSNAERAARNYRIAGMNSNAQADLFRTAGSNALASGYLSAGGSIIGGASQIASRWDAFKPAGSSSKPTDPF